MSVLAPHLDPKITSGERYWRVWISLVKWWPTQHALPKSAIFTEIIPQSTSSSFDDDLSSEIPETSRSSKSLSAVSKWLLKRNTSLHVRSFFSLVVLLVLILDAEYLFHRRGFRTCLCQQQYKNKIAIGSPHLKTH